MKTITSALLIGLMLVLSTASAIGANTLQTHGRPTLSTIYVDDDNTQGPWDGSLAHPYQYIQDGVNAATTGDTVYVFNGLYLEGVTIPVTITLTGESTQGVIIDGNSAATPVTITANSVTLNQLTMKSGAYYYGIDLEYTISTHITNCIITSAYLGIIINSAPSTLIDNCQLSDCQFSCISTGSSPDFICTNSSFTQSQNGIYASYSSNCLIQTCTFHNFTEINQGGGGSAVYFDTSPNSTVTDCSISNCTDYGVNFFFSSNGTVTNCEFYDNHYNPDAQFPSAYHSTPICLAMSPNCTLTACSIHDNDNGVYNSGGSPNMTMRNMTFTNNHDGSFDVTGWDLPSFDLDVDTSNLIDGSPILYLKEQHDLVIDSATDASYIAFINSTNITVTDTIVEGLLFAYTPNAVVSNVVSHCAKTGFSFTHSPGATMTTCEAYNTTTGVSGCPATMTDCVAHDSNYGFSLAADGKNGEKLSTTGGTITNCRAYRNNVGFYEQSGSTITACQAYDNYQTGFILTCYDPSIISTLRDNLFYNNTYNFGPEGWNGPAGYHFQDVDTSNLVNGKPILWIVDKDNTIIDGTTTQAGTIILVSSDNVTVKNIDLNSNEFGILLVHTTYSTFLNCNLNHNQNGIWLYYNSVNNTIKNCQINNNEWGIAANEGASYNKILNCHLNNNSRFGYWSQTTEANQIRNCIVHGNGYAYSEHEADYPLSLQYGGPGIMIHYSTPNNFIDNCSVSNNYEGIYVFYDCPGLAIHNCTVTNNTRDGVCFRDQTDCHVYDTTSTNNEYGFAIVEDSSGNSITDCTSSHNDVGIHISVRCNNNDIINNNFEQNTENAYDTCYNTYDTGSTLKGGNYWDDYTGTDGNGDGIGDTPYIIPGANNKDNYPFMNHNGWVDAQPPVLTLVKPVKALYLNDKKICGFFAPVIIKPITITVNASDNQSGIDHIDFFIDNVSQTNLTAEPYTYLWSQKTPLHPRHTIKIVAYDRAGNEAEITQNVWKFL